MSSLSMMESKLPPGFRFHPTDDELVCDYLAPRASGGGNRSFHGCQISDVDLNKVEPWDFPETACVGGPYVGSKKCYFFSLKDRKYATGRRTNRATQSGYWKATGKDRLVTRKGRLVGMRKTLVFYEGRAPKGKKTEWVMHEFRMEGQGDHSPTNFSFKEDWVLCKAFQKKGVISSKPSTETCYEDTVFSSLPPLLDNYMSFEQTPPKGLEQVPCFSNHQASQLPNSVVVQHLPPIDRSFSNKILARLVDLPEMGFFMNQAPCDEKVIKAVVNHITHLDSNQEAPLNMAEGRPESYWTEAGLPSSRSPHYELFGIPSHVGSGVFQS